MKKILKTHKTNIKIDLQNTNAPLGYCKIKGTRGKRLKNPTQQVKRSHIFELHIYHFAKVTNAPSSTQTLPHQPPHSLPPKPGKRSLDTDARMLQDSCCSQRSSFSFSWGVIWAPLLKINNFLFILSVLENFLWFPFLGIFFLVSFSGFFICFIIFPVSEFGSYWSFFKKQKRNL